MDLKNIMKNIAPSVTVMVVGLVGAYFVYNVYFSDRVATTYAGVEPAAGEEIHVKSNSSVVVDEELTDEAVETIEGLAVEAEATAEEAAEDAQNTEASADAEVNAEAEATAEEGEVSAETEADANAEADADAEMVDEEATDETEAEAGAESETEGEAEVQ